MVDKDRESRPWDLFNKKIGRVEKDVALERLSICLGCPELIRLTKQCKICKCFMDAKTKLPNASCPLNKWEAVEIIGETNEG